MASLEQAPVGRFNALGLLSMLPMEGDRVRSR